MEKLIHTEESKSNSQKSVTMNGNVHHITENNVSSDDDHSSANDQAASQNSLVNGVADGHESQAAAAADTSPTTDKPPDGSDAPQIVLTDDGGLSQTLTSSEDNSGTFPKAAVIEEESLQASDAHSDQISTEGNGQVPVTSDTAVAPLQIDTGSADCSGVTSEPASASLASPRSPTKKKSFWAKLAIIFKPWKWKRKKRSKKLESKAVGMF